MFYDAAMTIIRKSQGDADAVVKLAQMTAKLVPLYENSVWTSMRPCRFQRIVELGTYQQTDPEQSETAASLRRRCPAVLRK